MKTDGKLATTHVASDEEPAVVILSLERCLMTFINFYIARPTSCFILMYTCGLTVVIKRICYVMLCYVNKAEQEEQKNS